MGGVVISTYTGAETAQSGNVFNTPSGSGSGYGGNLAFPLGQASDILTTCQGDMGHGSDLSVGYSIIQFSSVHDGMDD